MRQTNLLNMCRKMLISTQYFRCAALKGLKCGTELTWWQGFAVVH